MNLANRITVLRILIVPIFVALLLYSKLQLALAVFIFAVLSDAVDGYIARTLRQVTKVGAILDPIADKLLLISAFASIAFIRDLPLKVEIPIYVPLVIISRDVIILIGAVVIYMLKGELEVQPSIFGKITTFFQMITIIFIFAGLNYSSIIWNLAIVFTLISGIEYLRKGSKILNEKIA